MDQRGSRPRRGAVVAIAIVSVVAVLALALDALLTGDDPGTDRDVDRDVARARIMPISAKETAEVLARVEVALRRDDRDPARLRALGREQQLAYRALSLHHDWLERVAAALPARTAEVVRANVAAGRALSALVLDAPLAATLPEWRIVAPARPDELLDHYREAETVSGIPWAYFAAIHFVETRFGRIVGPSSAGAQGPMQFIPSTWEIYGRGDIHDNRDAILAPARYLSDRGGPADMDRALFAYNNHERYVEAIQAYARVLLDDPRAYHGYYQWQVYYRTVDSVYLIPEGYPEQPAVRQHG